MHYTLSSDPRGGLHRGRRDLPGHAGRRASTRSPHETARPGAVHERQPGLGRRSSSSRASLDKLARMRARAARPRGARGRRRRARRRPPRPCVRGRREPARHRLGGVRLATIRRPPTPRSPRPPGSLTASRAERSVRLGCIRRCDARLRVVHPASLRARSALLIVVALLRGCGSSGSSSRVSAGDLREGGLLGDLARSSRTCVTRTQRAQQLDRDERRPGQEDPPGLPGAVVAGHRPGAVASSRPAGTPDISNGKAIAADDRQGLHPAAGRACGAAATKAELAADRLGGLVQDRRPGARRQRPARRSTTSTPAGSSNPELEKAAAKRAGLQEPSSG